jgi:hypothetical protein
MSTVSWVSRLRHSLTACCLAGYQLAGNCTLDIREWFVPARQGCQLTDRPSAKKPNLPKIATRTPQDSPSASTRPMRAFVDGHIDELHGWITAWAPLMPTQEIKALAMHEIYSQVGRLLGPAARAVRAVSAANPLSRSRSRRHQSPLQGPRKSPRPPRARSRLP